MLNEAQLLKNLESGAVPKLRELLAEVPAIKVREVFREVKTNDQVIDIVVDLFAGDLRRKLVCEFRANGQPRNVRFALMQLRDYVAHIGEGAVPVFIAPYLSPEARALCQAMGAGYLDFEGNARIVFDGVFIERTVPHTPPADRRELRSLFKPKSAQVLIALLEDPQRAWRVTELAAAAQVSVGHVSNIRAGLLDREWGRVSASGLSLSEPNALLNAWRDAYRQPAGHRLARYSPLHGKELEKIVRDLRINMTAGQLALASFSAARWLAPYAKTTTEYFYVDAIGADLLAEALKLTSPAMGENVVVFVPKDEGMFRNTLEPAPGAVCTGLVQTYLDLAIAGERGREAADHLRQERLRW